jgi:hypothetical protein
MVDFAKLKNNRSSNFEKLNQELTKIKSPQAGNNSNQDDRFWQPTVDKMGNGYAVIRFLPPAGEEDVPFVRTWSHGFQGPGGWYIENSLTTIGEKDPVTEYNNELWNSGIEANKETVRKQKRKLYFISNIYVVKDPANPENEGKVFLYKYGKKIFDKLNDLMNPQFEDEKPINPFDLWEGANFKLKIRKVEGYRNFDKSEFDSLEPLFNDDDQLETVWKQEHSLQDFISPAKFKSYDELKKRLYKVLGLDGSVARPKTTAETSSPWDDDEEEVVAAPKFKEKAKPKVAAVVEDDDDDDSLEFFKKLKED